MYAVLIPGRHPPVPVCDEPLADARTPERPAEIAPLPEEAPWPAPPRPIEREVDPEC